MQTNEQKLNQYRTPDDIVFDKHWFSKHQSKLLRLANSPLGKVIFRFKKMGHYLDPRKKISKITPYSVAQFNGNILRKGKIRAEYTEHFFSRNEYARKLYFVLLPMWYAMHIWDWFVADHFQLAPQLSFGFSTLTVNPVPGATVDGYCSQTTNNQTWATIIAAAGNGHDYTGGIIYISITGGSNNNTFLALNRSIMLFDTSPLTSGATISAATLSLYGTSKNDDLVCTPDINIYTSTPASNTVLANGDYTQVGSTPQCDTAITYVGFNAAGYNDFVLNATGLGNISKTSISKFGARNANYDVAASAPHYVQLVDSSLISNSGAAASNKPKLVVTYTVPTAPTVTTQAVSSIAQTTATGNGNVTSDGGATITERGVCWSTSSGSETAGGSHATSGGTTGAFTASITGLVANTLYYVKAYAINSAGTSYGSEVSFTTLAAGPANLKTINGLASASIKTINGLAIASVKTFNGLT